MLENSASHARPDLPLDPRLTMPNSTVSLPPTLATDPGSKKSPAPSWLVDSTPAT